MKTIFKIALLALPLTFTAACSQEVSHTESDKPGWFGGEKHESSTTYQNPDGTQTTTHEEVKTSN